MRMVRELCRWVTMMTSSNGNIFRVTGPLCGEFACHRWMPRTKPVTLCIDVLFDLNLNKRLSKQSGRWEFETSLCSLWRHHNGERYAVSDHRKIHCLLNRLSRRKAKNSPRVLFTGPFLWQSPHKRPIIRNAFPCHDVIIPDWHLYIHIHCGPQHIIE